MIILLEFSGINDWANLFKKLNKNIILNSVDTKQKILSLYGGMGSLNDLILQKNNVVFVNENDDFDILKSKLFNLCNFK
jgi:hypothetical protein